MVQYDLCSQCHDHIVEGKKDYHSEIYACIWNVLSDRTHRAADMKNLWQLIPDAMRKWWYYSMERIWGEDFDDDIKRTPSIFSDRSVDYQDFLAKLSGGDVNMATLRDALETSSMISRNEPLFSYP